MEQWRENGMGGQLGTYSDTSLQGKAHVRGI